MNTNHVIALAAQYFNVNPTTLAAKDDIFESLNIDSVQALELLTELEFELDIEIPDYDLRDVRTFQELTELIKRRR